LFCKKFLVVLFFLTRRAYGNWWNPGNRFPVISGAVDFSFPNF